MNETVYYGVIEAGGTKFCCAIVDASRTIYVEERINTTTPAETLDRCIAFFKQQIQQGYGFTRLGLASFGPLDLNPQSFSYGYITSTPKPGWSNTAIVAILQQELGCEVKFDTDVNAAALAEYRWGAAQHTSVCVYVTVGTGVGGGVVINGLPLHGLVHPEIGHMLIPGPSGIQGVCSFHGNCVEGLAAGSAMQKIWGQAAETLHSEHQAWDIQAQVLARLCHNLILVYSAEKIVFGGGVMTQPGLLDKVIKFSEQSLAGYVVLPAGIRLIDIICLPGLGQRSGIFGALALALPV